MFILSDVGPALGQPPQTLIGGSWYIMVFIFHQTAPTPWGGDLNHQSSPDDAPATSDKTEHSFNSFNSVQNNKLRKHLISSVAKKDKIKQNKHI